MNIIQAAILGIVEGLTEFLPISSTFHLILTSHVLGLTQTEFIKLFEVFIQAGAILAVLFLYGKEVWTDSDLMNKVLISFLPTAIIGFVLYKMIKSVFFKSPFLMVGVFILMAFVFFLIEYLVQKKRLVLAKNVKDLDYKQAVIIGLAQSLAVIPGVSRAGSVIVAMMVLGIKRDEAARYSFILSVPTILAASAYDLFKMRHIVSSSGNYTGLLIVGFIVSFISAFIGVRWFIGYLQKHSLNVFGVYRIIVGIIILLLLK